MSKEKDAIEIVEVSQSYGVLRIDVRFNYPDGSWQQFRLKTSPERPDEEIMDQLQQMYEQRKPEKIQAVRDSVANRKARLDVRAKAFGKTKEK